MGSVKLEYAITLSVSIYYTNSITSNYYTINNIYIKALNMYFLL